jgi:2-succinyl-5-enolpyruvyl-6-hydroxy-3-cyclohexene-1-carboxylate synthase
VINKEELETSLKDFYSESLHPKILEIESSSTDNALLLKTIKERVEESLKEK